MPSILRAAGLERPLSVRAALLGVSSLSSRRPWSTRFVAWGLTPRMLDGSVELIRPRAVDGEMGKDADRLGGLIGEGINHGPAGFG